MKNTLKLATLLLLPFSNAYSLNAISGNTISLQQICRPTLKSSSGSIEMFFGPKGKINIRSSPGTILRNFFMGGKRSSNNISGNGGGNGNKLPPSGPLASSSSSDGDDKNAVKSAWAAYNSNLEKHPILTKAITSMIGFALGDFLAQKFIDKSEKVDLIRLARLSSFGALIHGPTGHFFYGFLDSKIPGTAALTVATKVFIDQVIWNPIFGIMFFSYMGACEGLNLSGIQTRIEKNLLASVKGSWTVWPVAHAINFRFIPTSQRLLYINSIQIGYNMFLSVLSKRASSSDVATIAVKGKKS